MTPDQLKQLGTYINEILNSFKHAYRQHARGQSETAIFIQFDIWAAGNPLKLSDERIKAHRAAVKSAVEAVDAGVPWLLAQQRMQTGLTDLVAEALLKGTFDDPDA
jgi:hypothetical protein